MMLQIEAKKIAILELKKDGHLISIIYTPSIYLLSKDTILNIQCTTTLRIKHTTLRYPISKFKPIHT